MAFTITYVDHSTDAEITTHKPKEHRNIPKQGQNVYLDANGQSLYIVHEVRHNYQGDYPHVEVQVNEV